MASQQRWSPARACHPAEVLFALPQQQEVAAKEAAANQQPQAAAQQAQAVSSPAAGSPAMSEADGAEVPPSGAFPTTSLTWQLPLTTPDESGVVQLPLIACSQQSLQGSRLRGPESGFGVPYPSCSSAAYPDVRPAPMVQASRMSCFGRCRGGIGHGPSGGGSSSAVWVRQWQRAAEAQGPGDPPAADAASERP